MERRQPCRQYWTGANGFARGIVERVLHTSRQARRIDYILVGSPHDHRLPAWIRSCRIVLDQPRGGVWPSDHCAVLADLEAAPG